MKEKLINFTSTYDVKWWAKMVGKDQDLKIIGPLHFKSPFLPTIFKMGGRNGGQNKWWVLFVQLSSNLRLGDNRQKNRQSFMHTVYASHFGNNMSCILDFRASEHLYVRDKKPAMRSIHTNILKRYGQICCSIIPKRYSVDEQQPRCRTLLSTQVYSKVGNLF